jgi:hypothetical protein
MTTQQQEWERLAGCLRPATADAIEQNVAEQGVEPETEAFWAACVREAAATDAEFDVR